MDSVLRHQVGDRAEQQTHVTKYEQSGYRDHREKWVHLMLHESNNFKHALMAHNFGWIDIKLLGEGSFLLRLGFVFLPSIGHAHFYLFKFTLVF